GGVGHGAKSVVSVADEPEYLDFQFGSGARFKPGNESARRLQHLDGSPIFESPANVLCSQHEVANGFVICTRALEVQSHFRGALAFALAVGTQGPEPLAQPAVQPRPANG